MKLSNLFLETPNLIKLNAEENFEKRMQENKGKFPINDKKIIPNYDSAFKERIENTIKNIEGKKAMEEVNSTSNKLSKLLSEISFFNQK